jgi:Lon protease-like protein
MATLPLFPLNTVLFPGGRLPLRIFEERYKAMLRACLDGDRRLGVVLIKSGREVGGPAEPCQVGTVARIGELGEPDGGAIPLTVSGEHRFRILSVDSSLPYLVGTVEFLDGSADSDAAPAAAELQSLAGRYLRLLLASHGEYRGPISLSDDPAALEQLVGSLLFDHSVEIRQAILEAEPMSHRLRLMARAVARSLRVAESALMRSGPGRERSVFGIN